MGKTEGQFGRTPVGPIEEAIEELVKDIDGIVLEVTPVIFDEGVSGRCFDVTGKGIDSIELRWCQWPITGHEFITLVFAHLGCPPCDITILVYEALHILPPVISLPGFHNQIMLSAV
jgi:hypothetical protein